MLRLALLGGRNRTMRRRPGAHVVDDGRNVRVAGEAEIRVERLQRAHSTELRHPWVVHHAQVIRRVIRGEGGDQFREEVRVREFDNLHLDAGLALVIPHDLLQRPVLVALDGGNDELGNLVCSGAFTACGQQSRNRGERGTRDRCTFDEFPPANSLHSLSSYEAVEALSCAEPLYSIEVRLSLQLVSEVRGRSK